MKKSKWNTELVFGYMFGGFAIYSAYSGKPELTTAVWTIMSIVMMATGNVINEIRGVK